MPRKYHGEPEREPDRRKVLERIMREIHPLLKADPEPIKEIRKHQGKPKFDLPAQKSGLLRNTLRKPIDPSAPKKKRTFKYKPMA